MSRRKHLAARDPSGHIARAPRDSRLLSPAETRRLLDQAKAGLRDPLWATMLGRIYLAGQISASEFAAGKRWAEITASYHAAMRAPRAPRTVELDATGGRSPDPDSLQGEREVERHDRASKSWISGRNALRLSGLRSEAVVDSVCIDDCAPVGHADMESLRSGLAGLASLWAKKR